MTIERYALRPFAPIVGCNSEAYCTALTRVWRSMAALVANYILFGIVFTSFEICEAT